MNTTTTDKAEPGNPLREICDELRQSFESVMKRLEAMAERLEATADTASDERGATWGSLPTRAARPCDDTRETKAALEATGVTFAREA